MPEGPQMRDAAETRGVIVLGIDPGLTRCGVGAVRGPTHRPSLVLARCVRTPVDLPIEQRLRLLHDALEAVVAEVGPDVVAVERVLFSGNARTAMATGQAAGVTLLVAARHGLTVTSYSPNEVKQTVTGDGRADKVAVARLTAAQLGLDALPGPVDVTDALAVAITHLAHARGASADALSTPARASLERAASEARRRGRGGWAAVVDARRGRGDAA
jgi:crossover junction endodeoxyribonuclease RuvC